GADWRRTSQTDCRLKRIFSECSARGEWAADLQLCADRRDGDLSSRQLDRRGKIPPVSWVSDAPCDTPSDAGAVFAAAAVRNHLALSRVSFAPRHLWRGERLLLQRAYGHRGFRRDGTRATPAKMADRACRVRSDFRNRRCFGSASTLHHGCVRWNIRRTVGGAP